LVFRREDTSSRFLVEWTASSPVGSSSRLNRISASQREPFSLEGELKPQKQFDGLLARHRPERPEWLIAIGAGRRSETPARIGSDNSGLNFRKRAFDSTDLSHGSARM